ncbi:probable serine hydrolase, partial [Chelonus insularis]|uniref:probable serine hydrolase n=1 Tax=Chelonus insularis TaxID=460826 RepID=UPI00158CA8DC
MLLKYTIKFLKNTYNIKLNHSIRKVSNQRKQFQEVTIKVPWGTISGKFWGSTDVQPIIAVHGWQDNAASFDPLAATLPKDISLLAIDLPGHGHSSWLPNGLMYNTLIYIQALHRIKDYYGLDQFGLIGHSLGGVITFCYTSLFPNNAKFAIALDYFKYPSLNLTKNFSTFNQEWSNFFKYEKLQTRVPSYTKKELIDKWIKSSSNSLNKTSCEILMKRGVRKNPDDTVFFCRDPRIKFFLNDIGFSHDHFLRGLAHQVSCPFMIIKGENSHFNEPKEFYYNTLKIVKQHSQDFQFYTTPGTHHFHMDNAKQIAQFINPFILK